MKKTEAVIKKWGSCALFICIDMVLLFLAMHISLLIFTQGDISEYARRILNRYYAAASGITVIIFACMGIYNHIWKYSATLTEMFQIAIVTAISTLGLYLTGGLLDTGIELSLSYYLNYMLIALIFIIGSRLCLYLPRLVKTRIESKKNSKRLLIIGAGAAGAMLIDYLRGGGYVYGRPIAVVDDDPSKHGMRVHGVPVKGGCEEMTDVAERLSIDEIMLAIPSATDAERRNILRLAAQTGRKVTTLPPLEEIDDKVSLDMIRDIDPQELLPRPEIVINQRSVLSYLKGRTVLVTGGGGSIGSELCRQTALCGLKQLVIFDIYENNAFELMNELKARQPELNVCIRIGSVRDISRMREIFEEFHPEVVFHAAAHKHVPLMEDNSREAVKNNVFGTLNTARCAQEYGAEHFVLLSTDKAVNPTNVMGCTKRISELIMQHLNLEGGKTKFAAVRFGNVLGSNGSVIPTFKRQIAAGGPVTVTHPKITRYFMTIPEAARLVVQAGALAAGGEIFVLDMGQLVFIDDLARNMIRLSGFTPDKDIKIEYTGLRPGEKLYEELYNDDESNKMTKTENNKIFVLQPVDFDADIFWKQIQALKEDVENGREVRDGLKAIVPNFIEQEG